MKRRLSSLGFVIGVAAVTPVAGSPLKELPLSGLDEAHVSFGGQIRQRYEYFTNPLWGAGAQDSDGHRLQRYMLNADLRFNETVRAFVELKSGLVNDRAGGPRPTDKDELDLHQAFADARWAFSADQAFTMRAGRAGAGLRFVAPGRGEGKRRQVAALHSAEHTDSSAPSVSSVVKISEPYPEFGHKRHRRLISSSRSGFAPYVAISDPYSEFKHRGRREHGEFDQSYPA